MSYTPRYWSTGESSIKKILIALPSSIASKMPSEVMQNTYLRLWLQPDEYATIKEIEESSNSQTSVGIARNVRSARYGFSVNSASLAENKIYAALEKLSRMNNMAVCKRDYNITVIDYCQPDAEDILNTPEDVEPFTVRRGSIEMGQHSGSIGYGNKTYNNGLSFTFKENIARIIS